MQAVYPAEDIAFRISAIGKPGFQIDRDAAKRSHLAGQILITLAIDDVSACAADDKVLAAAAD